MSGARKKAATPAATVTAPEPEATAAAPASAASAEDQAAPAGSDPEPDTSTAAASASAEPAEGETQSSGPAEGDPAPSAEAASEDAAPSVGDTLTVGLDLSSGPDLTAVAAFDEDGAAPAVVFSTGDVAVQATSNRAPYTRGGIHFASRRTPVVLPITTTPDQTRRLVADTAITLALVHVPSGKTVELPRDLFGADGEPDFDRMLALTDDLARLVVGAEGAA